MKGGCGGREGGGISLGFPGSCFLCFYVVLLFCCFVVWWCWCLTPLPKAVGIYGIYLSRNICFLGVRNPGKDAMMKDRKKKILY